MTKTEKALSDAILKLADEVARQRPKLKKPMRELRRTLRRVATITDESAKDGVEHAG